MSYQNDKLKLSVVVQHCSQMILQIRVKLIFISGLLKLERMSKSCNELKVRNILKVYGNVFIR